MLRKSHNYDWGRIVKNIPARWPVKRFSEPRWYSDTSGKRYGCKQIGCQRNRGRSTAHD